MATDPNTGQSIINLPGFDQRYAAFIDPSQVGALASQNSQLGLQGAIAQNMMGHQYIPNSGFGGALAQIANSLVGMKMLRDMQSKQAEINTQMAQAIQAAAIKQREAQREDEAYKTNEAIRQATGIKQGEEDIKLKNADQEAQNAAKAKGLEAQATLPAQMALEKEKGQFQLGAASIAANAANRRGYVVQDAAGNQHIISPQGQEIYQTSVPGGGKLTPEQTAQNEVDVNTAKALQVRQAGAQQLPGNITNWVETYMGQPAGTYAGKSLSDLSGILRKAPVVFGSNSMASNAINPNTHQALNSIGNDLAINSATMKRGTVTNEIASQELQGGLSVGKTPEANARIIDNYATNIAGLNAEIDKARSNIAGRQSPGAGSVPAAKPGPNNPAPSAAKKVVRMGTAADGTRVAQYDDGSIGPAP